MADTDLAATRSHRQIEAMALVLWWKEKINSGIAGKAISGPIYTLT